VEKALAGTLPLGLLLLLLLLKGPAMAVTIGSGGSGGVFGPTVVMGALLGAAVGLGVEAFLPVVGTAPAAFVVVGMAAVFSGAARTPLSTLIMTAEMTGGYGLIVPTMLANILAFLVQRTLTHGARYPTLYQAQVESREDSPVHRGVFVRRALTLLEDQAVDRADLSLPRLLSLLEYGEPIPLGAAGGLLVTVELSPDSPLVGGTVAAGVGPLDGVTAVAVMSGGEMLVPRGATTLSAGDQVIALATSEGWRRLRELAAGGEESAAAAD
jgi:chloride channel protein, CIC family